MSGARLPIPREPTQLAVSLWASPLIPRASYAPARVLTLPGLAARAVTLLFGSSLGMLRVVAAGDVQPVAFCVVPVKDEEGKRTWREEAKADLRRLVTWEHEELKRLIAWARGEV